MGTTISQVLPSVAGIHRSDTSVPCLNQTSETIQVPLHTLYPHLPTPTLSQSHHNLQSPRHLRGQGQNPYKALGPTEPILTSHRFQCTGHQETQAPSKVTGGESLARSNRKKVLGHVNPVGLKKQGLTSQNQHCGSGDSVSSITCVMVV